jgi:energy-coupling factor transport system ATP-binding protein
MIEVKNSSFCYQSAEESALKNVSLRITPGECVVLCGKSGCGKTTLARLLNGLIPCVILISDLNILESFLA